MEVASVKVNIKRGYSYATSHKINTLLFMTPWLIGFIMFFLMPIVNSMVYSFNLVGVGEYGGMTMEFIGLQNYFDLFMTVLASDGTPFMRIFADENISIFTNTPSIVVLSLFSAILVNMNFKGRQFVRLIFFLPIVLGIPIVINLLTVSTGGDFIDAAVTSSIDSAILMNVLTTHTFLPIGITSFLASLVADMFTIISRAGVQTLVFLAGLQTINPSLYEMAKIEGANTYDVFWKITLPILSNVTFFVVIYTFVDLFLASPIATHIHWFAFRANNIGMGSALSVAYMINIFAALGILILVLTIMKGGFKRQ